jgi:hypothetical protein
MNFIFDVRNNMGGGGGGGSGTVTNVGTGAGLTGGPITTTGVISLADIDPGYILANLTGSPDAPTPFPVSDVLDSVFGSVHGDILFRGASGWLVLAPGSSGNFLQTGGVGVDPVWAAGGGGGSNFQYQDAWFLAKNGNDANDGKTVNTPKLTVANIVASFTAATNVINCFDNGSYPLSFTSITPGAITFFNAPTATFTGLAGPAFAVDSNATIIVECFAVFGDGVNAPFVTLNTGAGSGIFIKADIVNASGVNVYEGLLANNFAGIVLDVFNMSSGPGAKIITGGVAIVNCESLVNVDFDLSPLNNGVLQADIKNHVGTIIGNGTVRGTIGSSAGPSKNYGLGVDLTNQSIVRELSSVEIINAAYTLTENDSNKFFHMDSAGFPTVTLPSFASNPLIPNGFRCWVSEVSTGQVFFDSTEVINSVDGQRWSGTTGAVVQVYLVSNSGANYVWGLSGDLLSSNVSSPSLGIYVSAASGNDITGDGSESNPLATIGAAVTLAGVPVAPTPIYLMGSQNYDEQVLIAQPDIYIVGPQSVLFSTTGDALTISSSGSSCPIFLGGLGSSAGRSIFGTNDTVIVPTVTAFIQGAIEVNDNLLFISSTLLDVDITVTGAGFATYVASQRSGINTGAVFGFDPTGTSTNWNVAGALTASGLAYPVADGTAGQFMTTNGAGVLSFTSGGGGGGNFLYDDTWFLAKNGNDANDGKSVNTPKLTMSAVNAAFVNPRNVVVVLDNGSYPCFLFGGQVPNAVTYVNAPAAFFTAVSSAPVFQTDTSHTLIVDCFSVEGFGGTTAPLVSYNDGVAYMEINCSVLSGNGARVYAAVLADLNTVAVINADIVLGADAEFSSRLIVNADKVYCNFITSNFSGSGLLVADIKEYTGTITGTGEVQGVVGRGAGQITDYYGSSIDLNDQYFVNEIYGRMYVSPLAVTWSFVAGSQNGNLQVLVTNHDGTIFLPTGSSAPEGWRMTIIQTDRSSGARIQPQGLDTLCGQPSSTSLMYSGRGKCEAVRGPSNGAGGFTWVMTGDVFGSNEFTSAIYVSKLNGSDVDGDGSSDSPLATIGAAITLAGAPTSPVSIIIQDGETYDENLVFPNPKVHLIGPTATIQPAAGDAITYSHSGGATLLNVALIVAPGANAINCTTGIGTLISLTDVIIGDVVCAVSGSNLYFTATVINAVMNAAVGSTITYTAAQRSGTNVGNVEGFQPSGTTGNWSVPGNLTAAGLAYPVADGTAGQFMTTDGAGVLSFATPASKDWTYATIAGTTQLAVIDTAYLCANPAQTTITLPATAVFGDKVKVYGYGAAGWVLQANAGQTINLGTSSTTVAGSLTSAAATDLVEVTCLVANTLWQVDYVYSAGLTPA